MNTSTETLIAFRELSSPLIPWDTMERLVNAYDKISTVRDEKEDEKELHTVGEIISTMEQANRLTFS